MACLLRFDGVLSAHQWEHFHRALPVLVAARVAANLGFRLNRWSFRFAGLTDGVRIGMAGIVGTGLWTLGLLLARVDGFSRAVVVFELVLSTFLMAALRFTPRLVWMYRADLLRSRRSRAVRTLIVGAGEAGEMLLRDLQRSTDHDYHVLGFVDDDPRLWGDLVGGRAVLGGTSDIPILTQRVGVELVLIAIPNLPAERLRTILDFCKENELRFKILPGSYRHLPSTASLIQNLAPSDLLERDEVSWHDEAPSFSSGSVQLVAGAAGSIGSEVCIQLLEMGCRRLVMLDINENGLYMLKRGFERRYPDREIVLEVGDIRDVARVRALFARHRPVDVFHAAACKHVTLMESCPGEAVKTNVLGTRVLARAADEAGASRFVYTSTDKAVRPSNVMGATKRVGEMIVRSMDRASPDRASPDRASPDRASPDRASPDRALPDRGSATRFSVVRFGNVFDSAGSVIPVFREQIRAGGPVTVTHRDVRRYFMTISEAVGLVLRAAYGGYGQLCVLEMGEPVRILDLARDLILMSGLIPDVDVEIRETSLGPGEKLEEELFDEAEIVREKIDGKVNVVESVPPPENLGELVDAMADATAREDAEAVLALLWEAIAARNSQTVLRSAPV